MKFYSLLVLQLKSVRQSLEVFLEIKLCFIKNKILSF